MPEPLDVRQPLVDFRRELPREASIGALAESQHGVVTLAQLGALGLGRAAVARRAREGRLYRVHRGVYAVGRPHLTADGRYMAAVLSCGPKAALSHRSAADHWQLLPTGRRRVDVVVPAPAVRGRPGIQVHSSLTLSAADLTEMNGIRCTSVARTLADLGDLVPRRSLERAVEQAEILRLFDLAAVEEVLARAGRRRGAVLLSRVLEAYVAPSVTESQLEERMLALCRATSLPLPEVGAWITLGDGVAYRTDFLWRGQRLVIETDGYRFHSSRAAFERDRRRDQLLKLAGYEVLRFTWRDVVHEPDRVAGAVATLLARLARQ